MKLFESEHPYYCNEGNYFSAGCGNHYERWQDFVEAEGNNDPDHNLLFRWDWEVPTNDDDEVILSPDPYYRDCRLLLFWMGQRKGLYRWTTVDVCQADEPAVREWLRPRLDHLLKLWAPLADRSF